MVLINSLNKRIADKTGKEKRYTKTGFAGTNTRMMEIDTTNLPDEQQLIRQQKPYRNPKIFLTCPLHF